jgi:hypothetical protein
MSFVKKILKKMVGGAIESDRFGKDKCFKLDKKKGYYVYDPKVK